MSIDMSIAWSTAFCYFFWLRWDDTSAHLMISPHVDGLEMSCILLLFADSTI